MSLFSLVKYKQYQDALIILEREFVYYNQSPLSKTTQKPLIRQFRKKI